MKIKYLLLLALIPLILVLIWFRNGNIMGAGESGLPFYDLSRMLEISRSAWADPALGNTVGIGVAGTPTYWFLVQVQNLGVPGFILEALFFGILFVVVGVSVYLLTREFFPKIDSKYALLASFFYWFNPLSLVNVWNRFLYNYMVFWAFLPLALLLFIKGIKKRDYRFAVLVSIFTTLFSYALTSPVFNILLWFLFIYISIFFLILEKEKKLFIVGYLLLTFLSFLLFNFWWISQLTSFVFSSGFTAATEAFFTSEGNLGTLTALSQRIGQLVDTTRFMHFSFFAEGSWWARIFVIQPFPVLEFVLAGIIFWTIYKYRKNRSVLFLGSFFIASLFLTKGNNPPFGEIFQFFFVKISALQVFRNPFEKFGFLLPLAAAPLFTFGISKLSDGIKNIRSRNIFFGSACAFLILVWGFPFWTGLVFTSTEGRDRLRSYEVQVPNYYKEVNQWLKDQEGNFRFVSLPIGGEGMTYTWDKPYAGVELSNTLFETPNISFNTTIPFYSELVSELSQYQINEEVLKFFPFLNSKYIVWRGDIDFRERRMADPQTVKQKLEEWVDRGLLSKRHEKEKLAVYEVNQKWFWPKIYITPQILVSNEIDLTKLVSFNSGFPESRMVVINPHQLSLKNRPDDNWVIAPDRVFSPQVTAEIQKFTDEDLLARLFYVKNLPDKWFYFLIRWKEILQTPSQSDYAGWVLYKTGILGKRAVETYKLKSGRAKEKVISQAEKEYLNNLKELTPTLSEVVKSNSPVSNVLRESLLYQWLLLSRASSRAAEDLSKLLLETKIKPWFALPHPAEGQYVIYHFEIPVDGEYTFFVDGKISALGWFLDGKPLGVDTLKDNQSPNLVKLNKGIHEIALLATEFETLPLVSKEDNFRLTEKDTKSWNVDVPDVPATYRIEFDFRFSERRILNLAFFQDIDKPELPVFASQVVKDEFFHDWRQWSGEFSTSVGVTNGILKILPVEKEVCVRQWWGGKSCKKEKEKFDVEIRNLTLRQIAYPNVFLTRITSELSGQTQTMVEYTKTTTALYKIEVKKPNSTPEMLVFSELFNSGWEARFEDGTKVPDDKHFLVNDYANGWLIDRPGNYEITLKFTPQKLLDKGKKVSWISIVGGLVFLGVTTWKKRKTS